MVSSGEPKVYKLDTILEDFKDKISKSISHQQNNVSSDIFIEESLSLISNTASEINNRVENLTKNISKLFEEHKFNEAEEILSQYGLKLRQLCSEIDKALNSLENLLDLPENQENTSTIKLFRKRLTDYKKNWDIQKISLHKSIKDIKTNITNSFSDWENNSKQKVEISIKKLDSFTSSVIKKILEVNEKIEQGELAEVQNLLLKIQKIIELELEEQSDSYKLSSKDFPPTLENLYIKWKQKIKNSKTEFNKLILPLSEEIEMEIVKSHISELTKMFSKLLVKVSELSSLLKKDQLTSFEKEIQELKKNAKDEFKIHKEKISKNYKKFPEFLSDLISDYKFKLKTFETKFKEIINKTDDEYMEKRAPQLITKIETFINQTLDELKAALNNYKREAMNQIRDHFTKPNQSILKVLNNQKKTMLKEISDKEKHVQLVFDRYKEYSISSKKAKWEDQLKKLQNKFSEMNSSILSFLEIKDEITKSIDCYYEMAKPAYGYKVPLQAMCSKLDSLPEDKLENLFVELISNNFISGEIDPVTKVIVLAPKVTPEQQIAEKPRVLRCTVCNLIVKSTEEEIVYCPYCNSPAHRPHLIEWIKIKGFCPNCKKEIKMI